MALQNRSSTWGTTTMLVTRWSRERVEDHPRVPAPDVQHVGPDIERVVQPDGLLEQVRQRQQRHDPMVHRRDDPVERLDRRDDVVVGQHHALRRAGRAAGEDELEDLVGGRPPPGRLARLPVGRERGSSSAGSAAQRVDRRRREVRQAGLARIGRIAARAQDQVPGARRADDHLDRVGDIRRSSGTSTSRACIAP